jgi:hypothetical protein
MAKGNFSNIAVTYDKLIVDGLANLAHRQGENPRKFFSRLEKLFNVLHENYASYRIKPERPAPIQPQGTFTQDALTQFANDSVEAYNNFLFAQVFKAAAPENVRKLLSPKDQTRLTVDDAYQTFFTEHRVEQDKRQNTALNVHAIDENVDQAANQNDQNVAAITPDILSLKTTRAFWRQNTFTFNKPAPLGAKILGAFHWKCSSPFYS